MLAVIIGVTGLLGGNLAIELLGGVHTVRAARAAGPSTSMDSISSGPKLAPMHVSGNERAMASPVFSSRQTMGPPKLQAAQGTGSAPGSANTSASRRALTNRAMRTRSG